MQPELRAIDAYNVREELVKYVRAYGQQLPQTVVEADYRLISPAFTGSRPDPKALRWCIQLVQKNPTWQLTLQMHKLWAIR